jgi:hypothetical protein
VKIGKSGKGKMGKTRKTGGIKLIGVLLFFSAASLAFAEAGSSLSDKTSGTVFARNPQSVGVGIDFFSSEILNLGLRYSRWFGPLGFELSLAPRSGSRSYFPDFQLGGSLGFAVLVGIFENDFSDYLSSRIFFFGQGIVSRSRDSASSSMMFMYGAFGGIGFETVLFEHLSWVLDLGYSASLRENLVQANISPNVEITAKYIF